MVECFGSKIKIPKDLVNYSILFLFVCPKVWSANWFSLLADGNIHRALRIRKILGGGIRQ
jgi:hypothetical protein